MFNTEIERVATFSSYPDGDTPSMLTLANSGFSYSGNEFRVICPVCHLVIENFKKDENPLEEHRKRSPSCELVERILNSYSLPTLSFVSEAARQSSSNMLEIYNSAMRRSVGNVQTNETVTNISSHESLDLRIDRQDPDYELLRSERCRLDTFYDWPKSANANPKALAHEGFYYTGTGDKVCCVFCRNCLHTWESEDIPSEEHRTYYPHCPFVQDLNVANVRIEDEVLNSNSFAQDPVDIASTLPAPSELNNDPAVPSSTTGTGSSVNTFMSTPTVRAVLEMGFPGEVVKQTVQQELDDTGEFFQNAETLLERLLLLGVKFSSTGETVEANEALIPEAATPEVDSRPEATSSTTSTEHRAPEIKVTGPTKQEIGPAKKRKVRKRKGGASANVNSGSSSGEGLNSTAPVLTSRTNTSSNSATAAKGGGRNSMSMELEEQELFEENARLKEARICKVCMDKEVNTVFLPCGHLICCDLCSPQVKNCPLCRTFIRGTVKTYLS